MKLVALTKVKSTTFYVNCPISKTGLSISSSLDMNPSDSYPLCIMCQYNNWNGGCACARRTAGIQEGAQLISPERLEHGSKTPITVTFSVNGEIHKADIKPSRDMGDSIVDLWQIIQPESAVFLNLRTGVRVRMKKDPRVQFKAYSGKCYGEFSKDGAFYKNGAIFGTTNKCWACISYQKNGQIVSDLYGWNLPI